jgi:hypothetical protein
MHIRTLGQGLEVSAIGLGAMGMSQSYGPNPGDRDEMIRSLEQPATKVSACRKSQLVAPDGPEPSQPAIHIVATSTQAGTKIDFTAAIRP